MRTRTRISTARPSVLVGTDIVEVAQVAESMAHFGDRYLSRVFTEAEVAYCTGGGRSPAPHLAARFAAKEATMKVLRPGPGEALDWRAIEVVRSEDGWCELRLRGSADTLARRAGLGAFAVSLSHEAHYATAVVVAERVSRSPVPASRPDRPRRARPSRARNSKRTTKTGA